MKLFWGMIDIPIPHMHCFDAGKWVSKKRYAHSRNDGKINWETECYQNTCMSCGDLIQREIIRGKPTE